MMASDRLESDRAMHDAGGPPDDRDRHRGDRDRERERSGRSHRDGAEREDDRDRRDRDRHHRSERYDDDGGRRRRDEDGDADRKRTSSRREGGYPDDDERRKRRHYDEPDDRYRSGGSGRDRERDRGGDRDPYYGGGGRGGGRRDDYGGGHRRDHGGHDRDRDRRGGGGGGDWREEEKPRASPVPEGTRRISERMRKDTKWDVKAAGFEAMTSAQAKATGYFGVPGQARTMDGLPAPQLVMTAGPGGIPIVTPATTLPPIRLAGFDGQTVVAGSNANRQARRLYVGGIGWEASEAKLTSFFNTKMTELKLTRPDTPGDACIAAQVNTEKGYAFVEFRSPDEATSAMAFDGIVFQGQSLKIRRPKDYVGPDIAPPSQIHVPGVVSTNVPDGPNKIYVGSLPTYLNEEQVMELLKAFGELRAFNLVKDPQGGSKGFAFCEYVDPALTDAACTSLNDMELGDKRLVVQRASTGAARAGANLVAGGFGAAGTGANAGPLGAPLRGADGSMPDFGAGGAGEPTAALTLLNMVTPDELADDEEYGEIVEDVRDECARYGEVVDVRIPRPVRTSKGAAAQTWKRTVGGEAVGGGESEGALPPQEREGVGRVFVRFAEVAHCAAALRAIAGRQFGGRTVIAAFLNEKDWPEDEDGGQDKETTVRQAMGDAATVEGAAAGEAEA